MYTAKQQVSWGFLDIIIVYIGIIATGIILGIVSSELNNWFLTVGVVDTELAFFTASFMVQFFVTVFLVIIFTVTLHGASLQDIGIRKASNYNYIVYGLGGGACLIAVILLLGWPINVLQPDLEPQLYEEMLRASGGNASFLMVFLIGTVLAPLSEELFYRGMIYPVFRKYIGSFWGRITAGILFGLVHMDLWRALPLAAGGIILCYIYEKTGSIFVSTLAHGIWNGTMSVVVYLSLFNI